MFRQRFSCLNMPQHEFNVKFRIWLSDLDITRPFVLEEGALESIIAGQSAFGYIVNMEDRSFFELPSAEAPGYLGKLNDVPFYSCAFNKHDEKHSSDVPSECIEYRVEYP